jgi:hypothetical protein
MARTARTLAEARPDDDRRVARARRRRDSCTACLVLPFEVTAPHSALLLPLSLAPRVAADARTGARAARSWMESEDEFVDSDAEFSPRVGCSSRRGASRHSLKAKPVIQQKGGWTDEEDARLTRCVPQMRVAAARTREKTCTRRSRCPERDAQSLTRATPPPAAPGWWTRTATASGASWPRCWAAASENRRARRRGRRAGTRPWAPTHMSSHMLGTL